MPVKKRGHFCWSCGRRRPNEQFSGRNHGRHLCRECAPGAGSPALAVLARLPWAAPNPAEDSL